MQLSRWTCALVIMSCVYALSRPIPLPAQELQGFVRDFSRGVPMGPNIIKPYLQQPVPPLIMENSKRLRDLIHDGKMEVSLADALALAIENNLDITVQRFIVPMAQTDVLRTKAASAARGFSGASIPLGLSAGALGAGVSTTVQGGGVGSTGGITGGGGAISIPSVGVFDPTVNYSSSWDRTSSPLNTVAVSGVPAVTSYSTSYQGSYTQLLPDGTSFFTSLAGLRGSSTQLGLLFDPNVSTRMSMGFNQPLLNSFGMKPNERFLIVARNNQRISGEIFRQQMTTTIVQVEDAYWDMAQFQENVKVAQQSLAASQQLFSDTKKQEEVGTLAPLDVLSAQAQVASSQRDLVLAETNLQMQQTTLKQLLSKQFDPEVDKAQLITTDRLPEPRDSDIPKLEDALADAMNNRSDLRIDQVNINNENVSTVYTRNNLLPTVSVASQYAASGLQGNCTQLVKGKCSQFVPGQPIVIQSGVTDSLNQMIDGAYPEYSGVLNMTIPIRNRAAQADNLRAQLETQQAEITLARARNQDALAVRQAVIGLVQGKAQVQAAHEAVRLAQQTLDAEQKKLAAGVSTSYNVVLRQRDLTNAEYAEVQAVDSYAKALVAMDQSRGGMMERNGIKFDDALAGSVTKMPTPPFNVRGFSVGGEQGQ